MNKNWIINKKFPESFGKKFPEMSDIVLQLLWDRKIRTQAEIDEFFNPDYETDLHDPYLMKDMAKAVKRIIDAIENDEKILIYGDYDVDGVTSSAVLNKTFIEIKRVLNNISREKAKSFIDIYIPDREKEGYGITDQAVEEISKRKPDLIVTVDCGVSNRQAVEEINKLGIDIIVTDHHHVPEEKPKALAILNPKQPDCKYPFKTLAGVGVAFKLSQALFLELEKNYKKKFEKLSPGFEKWLLDLVALGTVADCVDLIGENRSLTKYGLLVLNKTKRTGIRKLIEKSGLETRENGNFIKNKIIDTINISFNLAPRLNAAGRIDHANVSYKLLISENAEEAEELAEKLERSNQTRQRLTDKMIKEIKEKINKKKKLPKIIIASGEKWKMGIVGLVAGKMTEEYSRPFIVMREEDGIFAGSGRSILKFNLIESIEKCKEILIQFGGHSQAAGLRVKKSNLPKFRKKMEKIAEETLTETDLIPSFKIDYKIPVEKIDWKLIDDIEKFAPFGFANSKPLFCAENLEVHEIKTVGSKKDHLKLCFKYVFENEKVKYFPAIGFRLGEMIDDIDDRGKGLRWGDKVNIVFQAEINEWNGNRELQLNVLDIKLAK